MGHRSEMEDASIDFDAYLPRARYPWVAGAVRVGWLTSIAVFVLLSGVVLDRR